MTWQHVQILGFAPDIPNTTPGVLTQTVYTMPTDRGLGPVPTFNEQGSGAVNTQSLGGFLGIKTDGTQRVFVGTATKLYETANPPSGSPTDRSDTSYSASTTDTWSFAQFGDYTFAANQGNILRSSSSGAFAAVGVAPTPKASIICMAGPVSAPVLFAFDYDDGSGRLRDGWFASGLGNPLNVTGWTTGTNSCVNGRLIDEIPGGVTAAIGYRDDVVAFKYSGMYIGTYTGDATDPWSWRRISGDIGCIGKNAVTKANDILYWVDAAGVWMFDGSYPRPVPGNVHNYWASNCAGTRVDTVANRNFFHTVWDKSKHWLHVFSGLASGPSIEAGMTWNSVSGLWTQHGGTALGGNPFTNTAGTTYAVELIGPRLYVTNNKKIGAYTLPVDAVQPPAAIIDGWLIADHVSVPLLNGLRPHWKVYNSASLSFGSAAASYDSNTHTNFPINSSFFRSYLSGAEFTELINVNTGASALTDHGYGDLHGKLAAKFISWRLVVPAGIDWEITGISIDVDMARGRT